MSVKLDVGDTVLCKAKGNTQKDRQLNEILEDICVSLKDYYRDEGSATTPCKSCIDAFKAEFSPYRARFYKAVRMAMRENTDRKKFIRLMEKQDISVLFRESEAGRIYGITFIDTKNGLVANGSRLGKGYSASVFNVGDNPFLNVAPQRNNRQGQPIAEESRSDDIIAGIAD